MLSSSRSNGKRLSLPDQLSRTAPSNPPMSRRGSGNGSVISLEDLRQQLAKSKAKGSRFRRRLSESSSHSMKVDSARVAASDKAMASTVSLCAEKLTSTPVSSERSRVTVRTMKRGSGSGNILSSCDTIEKALQSEQHQRDEAGLSGLPRTASIKRRGSLSDASASLDCGNSAAATKTSLRSSWRHQQQGNRSHSIESLIGPIKVPTDIIAASVAVKSRRRKSTSDAVSSPVTVSSADAAAAYYYRLKSVMRVPTLDESLARKGIVRLHSSGRKSFGSKRLSDNSSNSNACPFPQKKSLVSFSHIDVRLYERTLGDNPSCSGGGPPVTIGWKYFAAQRIVNVDQHESKRCMDRVSNYMRLRLSAEQRWNICQRHHTSQEIYSASDDALSIRRSRMAAARDDQRWFSEVMMNAAVWSKKLLVVGGGGSNHRSSLIKAFVARDQLLLQQYQELKKEEQQQSLRLGKDPKLRTKWSPKFARRSTHCLDNSGQSSSSSGSVLSSGSSTAVSLLKRSAFSGSSNSTVSANGGTNPFDSFLPAGQGEKEMSREEKEHLLKHVSNVRGCFRHKDSLLDLTVMLTNDHSDEEEEQQEQEDERQILMAEKSRRRRRRASFSTPSDVTSRKSGRRRESSSSKTSTGGPTRKGSSVKGERRRSKRREALSSSCDLPKHIQVDA